MLVAGVERPDDALDRRRGVDRVQRREYEVSGFGRLEGDLNRLAVAHLADEDDLGSLAEGCAQREGKRRRVAVQFALVYGALLVAVQELDRILNRQDVLGTRLV